MVVVSLGIESVSLELKLRFYSHFKQPIAETGIGCLKVLF